MPAVAPATTARPNVKATMPPMARRSSRSGPSNAILRVRRNHLELGSRVPANQDPLANRRIHQEETLRPSEPEALGQLGDGPGGLLEQELNRGIGDHRLAGIAGEEVENVLRDDGESDVELPRGLWNSEDEAGGVRLTNEPPGLVDHEEGPTPAFALPEVLPQAVEHQEHGRTARLLGEIGQRNDGKSMRGDRHPATPLQQPSARSLNQTSQAATELTGDLLVWTLLALILDGLQQVRDRRRLKRVRVGVVRDSLKGVDPAERLLKDQGLGIGQSGQQLPEHGEDGELPIGTCPRRAA